MPRSVWTTVWGLLCVWGEDFKNAEPPDNVLKYFNDFRSQLHVACATDQKNLGNAQNKMRQLFDRKAEIRFLEPRDQVLGLLPVVGSPFQAKFSGPYTLENNASDRDLVHTPNRRKRVQWCHVNWLKPYYSVYSLHEW